MHGPGLWVTVYGFTNFIKPRTSNLRSTTRISWSEGVSLLLIMTMNDAGWCRRGGSTTDDGAFWPRRQLTGVGWKGAPNLGFQRGFLLRHRGDMANPFCSPWDGGRRLATVSLLPQAWAIVCGVFGAHPAMGKAPTTTVDSGVAPGALGSAPEGV
jgi:hypothetical protein